MDPWTVASLPKRTNWWGAFVIGLAGTILVTGVVPFAVQSLGAASIPLFLLVSGTGIILCLCLAELSAVMPDRTGGLPTYAYETFKVFGPGIARHVGGISAWGYGLGWFPVAPINMILSAKYIVELWRLPFPTKPRPDSRGFYVRPRPWPYITWKAHCDVPPPNRRGRIRESGFRWKNFF